MTQNLTQQEMLAQKAKMDELQTYVGNNITDVTYELTTSNKTLIMWSPDGTRSVSVWISPQNGTNWLRCSFSNHSTKESMLKENKSKRDIIDIIKSNLCN
jgi:hypothetical protein